MSELDGDMTDIADQRSHNTDVDNTWDCRGALTAAGLSCGSCGTELPPNYTLWNECGAPVTKIGHSRASTALFAIRQNGKIDVTELQVFKIGAGRLKSSIAVLSTAGRHGVMIR